MYPTAARSVASLTRRTCFLACALVILTALLALPGCRQKDDDGPVVNPIALVSPQATPASVVQGSNVLFTVDATTTAGTLTFVRIDLSTIDGSATQIMYNDGTHGDISNADSIFSYLYAMPVDATVGPTTVLISAQDSAANQASVSIPITVVQNQAPTVQSPAISRDPAPPGARVIFTVQVADSDGTINSVTVDLSTVGGSATADMFDDGTGGDATADDGEYSLETTLSQTLTPSTSYQVSFTAQDNATATASVNLSFMTSGNAAPEMTLASANPSLQVQRMPVTFSVDVTDANGIASVVVDLSSIGGSGSQAMTNTGGNTYQYTYILPTDCAEGSWNIRMTATDNASVWNYVTVPLVTEANVPPHFLLEDADPSPAARSRNVLFSLYVSDSDGTVASVTINLSALSGSATQTMYDDGTNGDLLPADKIFSIRYTIPAAQAANTYNCQVTATDDDGVSSNTTIQVIVNTNVAPTLTNVVVSPDPQEVGAIVHLEVNSSHAGGIASVTVDLSTIGGSATQALTNTGGSTYEYDYLIPASATTGTWVLTFTSTANNAETNILTAPLTLQVNTAPVITNDSMTPPFVNSQQTVTISVDVTDRQGLSSITADLSSLGKSATEPLTNAGGNTYTLNFMAPADIAPGSHNITVAAVDTLSLSANTSFTLTVVRFKLEHAGFLECVHGTSTSDIYMAGNYSEVCHWDGTRWRMEDPGVNGSWWSVYCEAANAVWLGGTNNYVRFRDGQDWSGRNISPASGRNYAVRGFWHDGSGNLYAVGGLPGANQSATMGRDDHDQDDGHLLAVYSGGGWNVVYDTVNDDDLSAIWGTSPNDIVAVGDEGLILHYNGSTWNVETIPTITDDFFAVWGYHTGSASLYWAVGGLNSGIPSPVIYHYNGTSWSQVTSALPQTFGISLTGICGSTTGTPATLDRLYVVGTYNMGGGLQYGTVWHSTDGQNYAQVTQANTLPGYSPNYFPYAPYRLILTGCWMPPGQHELWVAGHRTIQHYVPQSGNPPPPLWVEYSRGSYENTRAVDIYSASRAITWDYPPRPGGTNAQQISSIVHEYNAGVWYEYTDQTFTVGPGLVSYTMLDPPSASQGQIHPRIYSVKMFNTGTGVDVYGVGDDGHVIYWDGTRQTGHDFYSVHRYGIDAATQNRLYALWGTSTSDIWFGGEGNQIYHYLGLGWSNPPNGVTLPDVPTPPTRVVTSIWGTSTSDVYAVTAQTGVGTRTGRSGNVYYYDGSSWSSVAGAAGLPAAGDGATSGLHNLNGVWCASATEVYVVGDNGTAYEWDGSSWTSLNAALGGTTVDLNSVFGDATTGDVYIIGDDMHLWSKVGSNWHLVRVNLSGGDLMGGDALGTFVLIAGSKGLTFLLER
jgi:hypothetical protein